MNIVYRSLCGHMLSFLLGKCLGGKWFSHMVGIKHSRKCDISKEIKALEKWLPAETEKGACEVKLGTQQ